MWDPYISKLLENQNRILLRQAEALLDKVKAAGIVLGLLAAYGLVGYIEMGM